MKLNKCIVCGMPRDPKSKGLVTCSPKCSRTYRRIMGHVLNNKVGHLKRGNDDKDL